MQSRCRDYSHQPPSTVSRTELSHLVNGSSRIFSQRPALSNPKNALLKALLDSQVHPQSGRNLTFQLPLLSHFLVSSYLSCVTHVRGLLCLSLCPTIFPSLPFWNPNPLSFPLDQSLLFSQDLIKSNLMKSKDRRDLDLTMPVKLELCHVPYINALH